MVCLASGVVILSERPNFKELAFSVGKPLPLLSFNETTLFPNLEFYICSCLTLRTKIRASV